MPGTLLKIKRWSQVTLPADIRKRLNLTVGDYLEAEAVEGGIFLRPVSVEERKPKDADPEDEISVEQWESLQAEIEEGAERWAERDKTLAEQWRSVEDEAWPGNRP